MIKQWIFLLIVLHSFFFVQHVKANDEVTLTASAPTTVILGTPFQITYTANARVSDFQAPAITNFDILAGPFRSQSQRSQIINGNMSSSLSVTYTFTLQAQKTGTFTIPSASVTVDGKRYTSNGLSVKVLPADEQTGGSSSQRSSSNTTEISEQNLFIRPILSKTSVYEQEAVKLTYKLYTTYDVVQFTARNLPDFQGFLKQEMERSGNTQLDYENYNGRNFLTAVLYETVLFPQSSGEITIDRAVFETIIRVQSRRQVRSIFDEFFDSYSNVARTLTVPSVKVNVRALPDGKPADFNGVVGDFSLSSGVSAEQVKVNEAVTLKISINGNGNMRLIRNPSIDFPESFEVYDPKVTNNFKSSASGLSGSKEVEVMFIPRHAGSFEIPAYRMSYFCLKENRYKTLSSRAFKLQVLKSDGSVEESVVVGGFSRKEDVKQLGSDIRYIFTGDLRYTKDLTFYTDSLLAWMLYVVPALLAALLFFVFRKQVQRNSNLQLLKNRRANKVARKRLKTAQRLLKEGNKDRFHEELIKALWTYLSDKLTIPVAELTKEKVVGVLTEKNVPEILIKNCVDLLNECEFARYAPASGQQHRDELFATTARLISDLENGIKN
jgi:hypothetical protein